MFERRNYHSFCSHYTPKYIIIVVVAQRVWHYFIHTLKVPVPILFLITERQ